MAESEKTEFLLHDRENPCAPFGDFVCERNKEYLTKEEAAVLAKIRALRDDVLAIKEKLKRLETCLDSGTDQRETESLDYDRQTLLDRLEELREKRKKLDALLEEAHHRKMVLLGHVSP